MKWFNILRDRVRALRQREDVINDIDREMRLHLEMQVDANIKAGMSQLEAREKAMRSGVANARAGTATRYRGAAATSVAAGFEAGIGVDGRWRGAWARGGVWVDASVVGIVVWRGRS